MDTKITTNGTTVTRMQIIDTGSTVYEAWEDDSAGNHSTVMTIDGRRMGKVATRSLTPELDALPARSQERWDAVKAFHVSLYTEAYVEICKAYPHLRRTRLATQERDGEIWVRGEPATMVVA